MALSGLLAVQFFSKIESLEKYWGGARGQRNQRAEGRASGIYLIVQFSSKIEPPEPPTL
jgi:hypothetical protein